MKSYICASIVGLGSVACLFASAPASLASSIGEPTVNASEQDSETPRQGVPGRRLGGGTRGEHIFIRNQANLTALVTPDNLSVTTAERPTLLFYVPQMLTANKAEFILRDANDELIYESTFEVGDEGALVSVEMAETDTVPALTVNENYDWYFSIIPDLEDRASDIVVHGTIRRVDPAEWLAQQQLDAAMLDRIVAVEPLKKARMLYQQANMWHDAILILDELRKADPENEAIAAEWNYLLESAGLSPVAYTAGSISSASLTYESLAKISIN